MEGGGLGVMEGRGLLMGTGVEVRQSYWEVVEGGASQRRDSGIVLFSVISAHFSPGYFDISIIRTWSQA